ncbi:hypothetical protein B0T25DRAFT_614504 [Lasiosphaeria hispida]|uniref:Heterokaryon incompatibility domain-containing protein n=1 Tax=Lasiosphaeria hispida TaxID=260671 RepID=A0AAJ0H7X0_9PEZI|nr:hypothetical protein B0T25DRAFT_614504 [Lasiosphaeria hispida]
MARQIFDTSHPKFREALIVFVDQMWSAIFDAAVSGAMVTVIVIELLRIPLHFVIPDGFYVPEIFAASGWILYQWRGRRNLRASFGAPNNFVNHQRIDPRFRGAAWLILSVLALGSSCFILQTQTWLFWDNFWRICSPSGVVVCVVMFVALSIYASIIGLARWAEIHRRGQIWIVRVSRYALRPLLFALFRAIDETRDAMERYRQSRAENMILAERPPQGVLFQHTPMDSPGTHFRLLKLHVGVKGLACSLVVEPTETTIPYEAISWTWDPQGTRSLKIDGRELGISRNIYRMLTLLAPAYGTRYLWIDAICIDQTEPIEEAEQSQAGPAPEASARQPSEKEHQIPLMTTIYKKAHRVIAFPGVGTREDLAAEFIGDLQLHLSMRRNPQIFPGLDRSDHFPYRHKRESWKAFFELVQQRFWTRAWIIQEIVVAKNVVIRYGRSEISFDLLGSVVASFKTPEEGITPIFVRDEELYNGNYVGGKYGLDFIGRLAGLHALYRLDPDDAVICMPLSTGRVERTQRGMIPLPDLLVECSQSGATKAHDKVWALCGLNQDPEWRNEVKSLQPNYDLSERDLYKKTALAVLSHGGNRRFALLGIAGQNKPIDEGSPSWVPGLSQLPVLYPMDNPMCGYEAGGRSNEPYSIEIVDDETIALQGLSVDTVGFVDSDSSSPHIAYRGGQSLEEIQYQEMGFLGAPEHLREMHAIKMRAWIVNIRQMAKAHSAHANGLYAPTRESLDHAILATLICDDDTMRFPASRATIEDLELWILKGLCGIGRETESLTSLLHLLAARSSETQQRLSSQRAFGLIAKRMRGRQFAMSDKGLLMIVPGETNKGDVIAVFPGARVPYLLRPVEGGEEGRYTLIGEAVSERLTIPYMGNYLKEEFRPILLVEYSKDRH